VIRGGGGIFYDRIGGKETRDLDWMTLGRGCASFCF